MKKELASNRFEPTAGSLRAPSRDQPWLTLAVVDRNKYPESSRRFAYSVAKELKTSRIALSQTDLNKLDYCLKSFDTPKFNGK